MIDEILAKSDFKWSFKPDDWFLDVVLSNAELRHHIFIIKNYNCNEINTIVFKIYSLVKEERTKLENSSQAFINKKKYLIKHDGSSKIQISLEEEYTLKELIDQYKAYELIGWFHLGKNIKIFKYCVVKKQEIIQKIYPIVNLSIEKVIGSKVIPPTSVEFKDAVMFAWEAIIRYLPKIKTERVMFSVFIGIAQGAAINYNKTILKEKYNTVRINDIISNSSAEDDDVTEDLFVNTVISNNPDNDYSITNFESYIDSMLDDEDENIVLDIDSKNIDDLIDNIDGEDKLNCLQQNVLAYSFNVLSGKVKKMCFEKIFAEFFNDLINSNIPEAIIIKHTPVMLDIMSSASANPIIADDDKNNTLAYRLFKDWIKNKLNFKLMEYNIDIDNMDVNKKDKIEQLVKHEVETLAYLKENKNNILSNLISYKRACKDFSI